jgi:hypothetical protein
MEFARGLAPCAVAPPCSCSTSPNQTRDATSISSGTMRRYLFRNSLGEKFNRQAM